MLKPSDKWTWYYDEELCRLMLDLGEEMVFKTNLARKTLVNEAFQSNEFSVDDAAAFESYSEQIRELDMNPYRQAELILYCVAAKRYHKPVLPKSWYFSPQQDAFFEPEHAGLVVLSNSYSSGIFMITEVGDSSSLVNYIGSEPFQLDELKSLTFGDPIKVMHDRMQCASQLLQDHAPLFALVG